MNGSDHLIYALVFGGILFLLPYFLKEKNSRASIQDTVNALGILGTFVGITIGLFQLNLDDKTNTGISALIESLKYGFIASIVGFSASLAVKHTDIYGIEDTPTAEPESEKELLGAIMEELKKVNTNLTGDGEMTLATQMLKMRTSTADKLDELNKSFDKFAEQMAENNMSALIKAVNKVMENFNAKINDQLGESFKELSSSVKNLVEWQKDYTVLIKSSTEALSAAQVSLKNSSESLSNTSEKVSAIAENNKKIQELNQEYESVLKKLNEMLASSVGFSQGMKSLADGLSGSGAQIKREMEEMTKKNMETLSRSGDEIRNEVKNIVETSIKEMRTHSEEMNRNTNSTADASLKNMVDKNNAVLKEFEDINMKTLRMFGDNIGSISQKMADDFKIVQEALAITTR